MSHGISASRWGIPLALAALASGCRDDGATRCERDAAPCAPVDAYVPPDRVGTILPGEVCPSGTGCVAAVDCSYPLALDLFLCTRACENEADCEDVGFTACCMPPTGFQATALCVPVSYGVCAK